jgi:hypothetical protein
MDYKKELTYIWTNLLKPLKLNTTFLKNGNERRDILIEEKAGKSGLVFKDYRSKLEKINQT